MNLAAFEHWFNQRPLRERWVLLGAACLLIFFAWLKFFSNPLTQQISLSSTQNSLMQRNIEVLSKDLLEAQQLSRLPPSAALAQHIERLEMQLNNLTRISIHDKIASSPEQLQSFLAALANTGPNLSLSRLDHQGNKISIELEGGYPAALTYLQALDKLPWSFAFDRFDLQTSTYPNTKIKILLHALSEPSTFISLASQKNTDPMMAPDQNATAKSPRNLELSGIIYQTAGADRVAILNHSPYKIGDRIDGYEITQIEPNAVYLRYNSGQIVLALTPDIKQFRDSQ